MRGISKLELRDNITLVSFSQIPYDIDVIADIFEAFAEASINIDMVTQSTVRSRLVDVAFTCFDSDMITVLEISNKLADELPPLRPMVSSGNTKIQLYGAEMPNMHGVFSKVMNCLRTTDAIISLITTSEMDISVLIDTPHVDEAVDSLEEAFQL